MSMTAIPSYSEVAAIEDFRDLEYVIPELSVYLETLTEDLGIDLKKYTLDEVVILEYDRKVTCYSLVIYTELPSLGTQSIKYLEFAIDVQFNLENEVLEYSFEPSITSP